MARTSFDWQLKDNRLFDADEMLESGALLFLLIMIICVVDFAICGLNGDGG